MASSSEASMPARLEWRCAPTIAQTTRPGAHVAHGFGSQLAEDALLYDLFFPEEGEWNCGPEGPQGARCAEITPLYVEVGARDGQMRSVSHFFHHGLGWRGFLVEENVENCKKIATTRCDGSVVMACGGVCSAEMMGEMPLAREQQISGSGREHAAVPCAPLSAMLARAGLTYAHMVSIDVLGSDGGAVRTIDWTRFRFGVMIIELGCKFTTDASEARATIRYHGYHFLARHRFDEIYFNGRDAWAAAGAAKLRREFNRSGVPAYWSLDDRCAFRSHEGTRGKRDNDHFGRGKRNLPPPPPPPPSPPPPSPPPPPPYEGVFSVKFWETHLPFFG